MKWLGFCVLFAACGGAPSNRLTWGEGAESISLAYCTAVAQGCGLGGGPTAVDRCTNHSVHHLCELDETCDVELSSEAEEAAYVCLDAIAELDTNDWRVCFDLELGYLPGECGEFFMANPTHLEKDLIELQEFTYWHVLLAEM